MKKFKRKLFFASAKLLFKNMILLICILHRSVKSLEILPKVQMTKLELLLSNSGPLYVKKKLKGNQKELVKIL